MDILPLAWEDADIAAHDFVRAVTAAGGDLTLQQLPPTDPLKPHMVGVPGSIDIGYRAVIKISAAVNETNTCIEQIEHLIRAIWKWNNWGKPQNTHELFKFIVGGRENDASWCTLLNEARNHYAHQHTAFPAVDWTSGLPDVLLFKEDIDNFDNPNTHLRFSDLRSAFQLFARTIEEVQIYLMRCIVPDKGVNVIRTVLQLPVIDFSKSRFDRGN